MILEQTGPLAKLFSPRLESRTKFVFAKRENARAKCRASSAKGDGKRIRVSQCSSFLIGLFLPPNNKRPVDIARFPSSRCNSCGSLTTQWTNGDNHAVVCALAIACKSHGKQDLLREMREN